MSDCPMLISNKLHSFRNFSIQSYDSYAKRQNYSGELFGGNAQKSLVCKRQAKPATAGRPILSESFGRTWVKIRKFVGCF